MKIFLISLGVATLTTLGTWFTKPMFKSESKTAYILTSKVFDGFEGTKEKLATLKKAQEFQKKTLDSMAMTINLLEAKMGTEHPGVLKHKEKYEKMYEEIVVYNQEDLETSQDHIWKQINQYLGEYGKQNGYAYIYGAAGNGSIMFADSSLNISDDVLIYINKRYKDE
jgi:outer membrane protein